VTPSVDGPAERVLALVIEAEGGRARSALDRWQSEPERPVPPALLRAGLRRVLALACAGDVRAGARRSASRARLAVSKLEGLGVALGVEPSEWRSQAAELIAREIDAFVPEWEAQLGQAPTQRETASLLRDAGARLGGFPPGPGVTAFFSRVVGVPLNAWRANPGDRAAARKVVELENALRDVLPVRDAPEGLLDLVRSLTGEGANVDPATLLLCLRLGPWTYEVAGPEVALSYASSVALDRLAVQRPESQAIAYWKGWRACPGFNRFDDLEDLERALRPVIEAAHRDLHPEYLAFTYRYFAQLLGNQGRQAEALAAAERAEAIAGPSPRNADLLKDVYMQQAAALRELGRREEEVQTFVTARAALRRRLNEVRRQGRGVRLVRSVCLRLWHASIQALNRIERFEEAAALIDEALEFAKDAQDVRHVMIARGASARTLRRLGRLEEAHALIAPNAAQGVAVTGVYAEEAIAIALERGEREEARRWAALAVAEHSELSNRLERYARELLGN
jgi:tetratricopeptide (TPR) repeat protein